MDLLRYPPVIKNPKITVLFVGRSAIFYVPCSVAMLKFQRVVIVFFDVNGDISQLSQLKPTICCRVSKEERSTNSAINAQLTVGAEWFRPSFRVGRLQRGAQACSPRAAISMYMYVYLYIYLYYYTLILYIYTFIYVFFDIYILIYGTLQSMHAYIYLYIFPFDKGNLLKPSACCKARSSIALPRLLRSKVFWWLYRRGWRLVVKRACLYDIPLYRKLLNIGLSPCSPGFF